MAKKATATRKPGATRNWIAYLCESLVTSGVMPTWEALIAGVDWQRLSVSDVRNWTL